MRQLPFDNRIKLYDEITIDYVVDLLASYSPKDVKYNNILTITCRLTKRKYLIPIVDLLLETAI